jgi:hypothetical protein
VRRRLLLGLIAAAVLAVVAAAPAATSGGGRTIADAPLIRPGQRVEGNLGVIGCCNIGSAYIAEYFKIPLRAGDRVQIRIESAGDVAPAAAFFLPGTDDFTLDWDDKIRLDCNQTVAKRLLQWFTAGRTGTYIVALNNWSYSSSCYSPYASRSWAYVFTVLAPHYLRLLLPRDTSLRSGQRFVVRALAALAEPVREPGLTVRLFGVWGGSAKPKPLGAAPVRNGQAVFTLRLPASLRGAHVRLIATAGDNVTWISTRAGRSYRVP